MKAEAKELKKVPLFYLFQTNKQGKTLLWVLSMKQRYEYTSASNLEVEARTEPASLSVFRTCFWEETPGQTQNAGRIIYSLWPQSILGTHRSWETWVSWTCCAQDLTMNCWQ